jgi:hypothetical protein
MTWTLIEIKRKPAMPTDEYSEPVFGTTVSSNLACDCRRIIGKRLALNRYGSTPIGIRMPTTCQGPNGKGVLRDTFLYIHYDRQHHWQPIGMDLNARTPHETGGTTILATCINK